MKAAELITRFYAGDSDLNGVSLASEELVYLKCRNLSLKSSDFTDAAFVGSLFYNCDFSHANMGNVRMPTPSIFDRCCFDSVDFRSGSLTYAQFNNCTFDSASFSRARVDSSWFQQCTFRHAWFGDTYIHDATFNRCDVSDCFIGGAIFVDTDVSPFADADQCRLGGGRPVIDWQSVSRSLRSPNLQRFMSRCGMPEVVTSYMVSAASAVPGLVTDLLRSTFISYGGPDERFARQLRDELHRNGVRTWFFQTDSIPGQRLDEMMRDGVNNHDRVILICSRASLTRKGVRAEIRETLARETRDDTMYLIPITLDRFLFDWEDSLALPIRDRVVADFTFVPSTVPEFGSEVVEYSHATTGPGESQRERSSRRTPSRDEFAAALQSLLRALRKA